MAKKPQMESFKIGDTQKAGVAAPSKKDKQKQAEPQSYSLGFSRIETLLEKEDPTAVGAGLNALLQALEEFQSKSSTNKDKAAAKKAIIAVERAVDLIDYLFQTKHALENPGP